MRLTYQRSILMAAMAVTGSLAGVLLFDGPAVAQPEWKEVPLKDGTYRQYQATHRTDTVDIPVPDTLRHQFRSVARETTPPLTQPGATPSPASPPSAVA
jgi:hypothetical protein